MPYLPESSGYERDTDITPKISVIVPLFNQEDYVGEALESILAQEYPNLEIIVIDDGSSDNSFRVAAEYESVMVLSQKNRGPSAARNRGIQTSKGELVAFLDADDLWPSRKISIQLKPLIEDSRIDGSLGLIRKLKKVKDGAYSFCLDTESFYGVQLGSALFRRDVFRKVGLFDEKLTYSEDHDWFLRARENGLNIVTVDGEGLYYRVHEENMTRSSAAEKDFGLVRVLKRSLDRRRDASAGSARSLSSFSNLKMWKSSQ